MDTMILPTGYEVVDGEIQPRHMTGQYCECDECMGRNIPRCGYCDDPLSECQCDDDTPDYCPCCLSFPCDCQHAIDQGAS